MTNTQKIKLIESYDRVIENISNDISNHFQTFGVKKIDLINYLIEKHPIFKQTNLATIYLKIKNSSPWKYEEILIVCDYLGFQEKKEIIINFYKLLQEDVTNDIDKSPFQFKFLSSFFQEHFALNHASVYYEPLRWRFHLNALIELYRLIDHMNKFKPTIFKVNE